MGQTNDDSAKTSDWSFCNIGAHISDILTKLVNNLLDISLRGNLRKDLELQVLDVRGLVILYEKLFVLCLKNEVGAAEYQ